MPRLSLGVGAFCAVAVAAVPAAAEVVSLEQLTQRAVRNRPVLAAASARTRAASAQIAQARSGYYPRLALEAESALGPGQRLIELEDGILVQGTPSIDQRSAFAPAWRNELDLTLEGSLYDFGRTRAAVDAGRAAHAAAQAAEAAERAMIVQSVRAAYLSWLGAHELLAIAEQAAADAERRAQRVQALIAEGARPPAELSVARANEMLSKLELERARGQLRAARLALEHAVGSALPEHAEPDRALLDAEAGAAPEPEQPGGAQEAALRALSLRQQAENAEARRLERADAPLLAGALSAGVRTLLSDNLDVTDAGPDASADDFNAFPTYAVGLRFTLPLLDGGASDASADAARARAQALAAELEDERVRQRHERARAELDLDNALAQLRTAEALLEVASQRVRETEDAYELGAGGLDMLADARSLLRRAQTELVHAKLARAEALLRLEAR